MLLRSSEIIPVLLVNLHKHTHTISVHSACKFGHSRISQSCRPTKESQQETGALHTNAPISVLPHPPPIGVLRGLIRGFDSRFPLRDGCPISSRGSIEVYDTLV